VTPEAEARIQAVRDACRAASDDHGHVFHVEVSEGDAVDLASGYVPERVRAMVLTMLDWQRIDERRAERPVRKRTKK
jgi:hypothetical protein